jgi:hypothetical protein
MEFLDPDFFRTYCTAEEAYRTLFEAVKALNAAKSATAKWKSPGPNIASYSIAIEAHGWLEAMAEVVPYLIYVPDQRPFILDMLFTTLDLLEMDNQHLELQVKELNTNAKDNPPPTMGFLSSGSPLSHNSCKKPNLNSEPHKKDVQIPPESQVSNLRKLFNKMVHQVRDISNFTYAIQVCIHYSSQNTWTTFDMRQ